MTLIDFNSQHCKETNSDRITPVSSFSFLQPLEAEIKLFIL